MDWQGAWQQRLWEVSVEDDRALIEDWRERKRQWVELLLNSPGTAAPEATRQSHSQRVGQLERELQTLSEQLAIQVPEFELEASLSECDAARLAQALPAGCCLVEYVKFTYSHFNLDPQSVSRRREDRHQLLAFVLKRDSGEVRMLDLGLAEPIERAIQEINKLMNGRLVSEAGEEQPPRTVDVEGKRLKDLLLELRKRVWEPVESWLGGSERVYIAPDGDLNLLAFELLPGRKKPYLIDELEIGYVNTGRDLVRLERPRRRGAGASMVVANPDYDAARVGEPRGETRAVEGLLRSMKRERFESSARMNEEGWAVARTLGVKPWMGAEARKERLLSVESPKVLHIATHGFWVEFGPWEGERGLRGGGKGLDVQLAVLRNPLLRSGLALAGANEFLDEGVEGGGSGEGLMLAAEVEEMDLGATEMVVLSLCEGGSGASESGEGLYGMRRAFILSGARSVVANLWKAEDRATMFLMQRFYENLVERKYSRRQALREAQWLVRSLTEDDLKEWERSGRLPEEPIEEVGETEEERKRPFGDPAYWAGFIVQGEQGSL